MEDKQNQAADWTTASDAPVTLGVDQKLSQVSFSFAMFITRNSIPQQGKTGFWAYHIVKRQSIYADLIPVNFMKGNYSLVIYS